MDSHWTSRCDDAQNTNRLSAGLGQQAPAACPPYYSYSQDLSVPSISPQALHYGSAPGQRALPPRGRANKVTKAGLPVRRSSRQSSLLSTAQDQLDQLAADSTSNSPSGNIVNLTPIREFTNGPSVSEFHSSNSNAFDDGAIDFNLNDDHQLSHSMSSPGSLDSNNASVNNIGSSSIESAADIVLTTYPSVRIDSTLCKKLAGEAAKREPVQRRREQRLNIERRSNVEALLAHVTGVVAARPCKNCYKGHGPWTLCIVYDGQMCGSCTNCWFNASGSRCTFHENNNPPPPHLTPTVQASHELISMPQASVVEESMALSQKDRHLARIEAAAKELGMRIAEYNEYLQNENAAMDQSSPGGLIG